MSSSLKRLEVDSELRSLLVKLKDRKFHFTNSNVEHALRALSMLNLNECFNSVFHYEYSGPKLLGEPDLESYKIIGNVLGILHRENVHLFDDSFINIDVMPQKAWLK